MATIFTDRQSTRPNRFRVVPESGDPYYVTLERADEPTVQGTTLNAANLNSLVSRSGDSLSGSLSFENADDYYIYKKFRDVDGTTFGVNAGCGVLGGKGVVAFEVREGPDTASPRIGRLEIGELGVSYVDPSGKRIYLYGTGITPATVG